MDKGVEGQRKDDGWQKRVKGENMCHLSYLAQIRFFSPNFKAWKQLLTF